jgi:hypothetical protein
MNSYLCRVFFVMVFCLSAWPCSAWSDPNAIGSVVAIEGRVVAESADVSRVLELNSPVYVGETLASGPDSRVEVQFLDETMLSLGPSSRILLDSYMFTEKDQGLFFKLGEGAFQAITGKIVEQNPDKFKMETPLALIGIRGTTIGFWVRAERERVYALHITPPHVIEVQSPLFPDVIIDMTEPETAVDLFPGQPPGQPRPFAEGDLPFFDLITVQLPDVSRPMMDSDFFEQAFERRFREGDSPPAWDESPASPVLP